MAEKIEILQNRKSIISELIRLIKETKPGDNVLAIGRQIAWLEQMMVETEEAVKRGVTARVIGIKEGRAASYGDILESWKVGFKFNPIDHGDARIIIIDGKAIVAFPNTIDRKETEKEYVGFLVKDTNVTISLAKMFNEYWENARARGKSRLRRFISEHELVLGSIVSAIFGAIVTVVLSETLL